ncbi:glycosyltransferase family 2 protein [Pararhizobium mangrovi]|uniref:Glycosyltransferase n=1 Tax=Pararhizobium mangrovi TaxID=2590452 RepID=A0A506TYJ5_9HYPH|nr:glycosyltransferase [Pararhizobium mangrovi]TPW27163.1 glycosyltransferase [Pararhizobium mangrovi]
MPAVSVIVPVHNRAAFIGGAVESVLGQSFSDLELIVVDDGSTDETPDVLKAVTDRRLRIVSNGRNLGIPQARNAGLEAARGTFVAWLDSDDHARRDRLARQIRFFRDNPGFALVGGAAGKLDAAGRPLRGKRVPPLSAQTVKAWLVFKSAFQQSSVMGRAEVLKRYPYRDELAVCSDVDVFVRLAEAHRITNLPHVLVDRRTHPGQVVRSRGDAIRASKTAILERVLHRFGATFDADDLARHVMLGEPKRRSDTVDEAFLDWAGDWLMHLQEVNARTQAIEPPAFRFACGYFWMRACEAAIPRLGFARATRRFAGSALAVAALSGRSRTWLSLRVPRLIGEAPS